MEREAIYVGNKEVTQRYVGSRLVWEKIKVLYSSNVFISYDRDNRQIIIHHDFSQNTIKLIELKGKKISFSSVENNQGKTYITIDEPVSTFEQKTGFNWSGHYFSRVKIYGG